MKQKHRPYQIDRTLSRDDRIAYEAFISDRRNTILGSAAWLRERGYKVSHGAIWRHRLHFLNNLDEVHRWAAVAQELANAARVNGRGVFAEATLSRFEQAFLQSLGKLEKTDAFTPHDWKELAGAISAIVQSRERVDEQRREFEERAAKAAEAVQKANKKFDGVAIANRVREILGVPLPKEDAPKPHPFPGANFPPPPASGAGKIN